MPHETKTFQINFRNQMMILQPIYINGTQVRYTNTSRVPVHDRGEGNSMEGRHQFETRRLTKLNFEKSIASWTQIQILTDHC